MKSSNTSQRLQSIMAERDLKQKDILALAAPFCKKYNVKLGKTDLSQYVSGKFEPRQDKLTILGLALNVSEAWLMGYDVPSEREIAPNTASGGDERMSKLVELASCLNDAELDEIISLIEWKLSRQ